MENVLTEIIDLFPSEYIHIGGDEARKIAWKTCSKCQTLMEKEGLKDLEELQCYMIARMEAFLTSKGKRMIGWDEVLNNHLAPTSTIISYRGRKLHRRLQIGAITWFSLREPHSISIGIRLLRRRNREP